MKRMGAGGNRGESDEEMGKREADRKAKQNK